MASATCWDSGQRYECWARLQQDPKRTRLLSKRKIRRNIDAESVTLDGGENTRVTFTFNTAGVAPDDYDVLVASDDDSDSATVESTEEDKEEVVYWQVDFGEGESPPMPPIYWPNDLIATLGNSDDGVTQNPSVRRRKTDCQLGDVNIIDNEFHFDDEGNPTEVTVRFELEEDADPRYLYLAVFVLPGPFDEDEIDQQELFETTSATYEGGDKGELTVSIPQEDDDVNQSRTDSASIISTNQMLVADPSTGPVRHTGTS